MTSFPTFERRVTVTWDQLSRLLEKEMGILGGNYWQEVNENVREFLFCDLEIMGTNYYLKFDNDEELIHFILKHT